MSTRVLGTVLDSLNKRRQDRYMVPALGTFSQWERLKKTSIVISGENLCRGEREIEELNKIQSSCCILREETEK